MIGFTRDLFRTLAAPCSAHALHISRRMDGQLTTGERAGLWLHMRACASCRAFARQLERLRTLARADSTAEAATQPMPATVRDRLAARLAENAADQPPTP